MFTRKIFLKFHHTDAAGILFFSNIYIIAHDMYEEMLEEIGFSISEILEHEDFLLPIIHSEADYKRPIKAGDELAINAAVDHIGNTSFSVVYQILNVENNVAATVKTVVVVIDKKTGKKRKIPERLKEGLVRFCTRINNGAKL